MKKLILVAACCFLLSQSFGKCYPDRYWYNYTQNTGGNNTNLPISINPGDSIFLSVQCNGGCMTSNSQWYYNGVLIPNSGTSDLNFVPQPGVYFQMIYWCDADVDTGFFYINYTTGITDEITFSDFTISPNPAKEKITISCYSAKADDFKIAFYDMAGKCLKEFSLKHFVGELKQEEDISWLPAGIYFIKAGNSVKKFVKQ